MPTFSSLFKRLVKKIIGPSDPKQRVQFDGTEKNAAIVRDMINKENELMNHRMTWLLGLEGLLFAGLGFAWQAPSASGLIYVFAFMGIAVPISIFTSFRAAEDAIADLRNCWDNSKKIGAVPDVIGSREKISRLLCPWVLLPVVIVIGWLLVCYATAQRPKEEKPSQLEEIDKHLQILDKNIKLLQLQVMLSTEAQETNSSEVSK